MRLPTTIRRVAAASGGGLLLLAGGCGRKAAPTAPPASAYVSLERLAARHPLWSDLQRLQTSANQLEGVGQARATESPGAQAAGVLPGQTLVLPALALPSPAESARLAPRTIDRLRSQGRQRIAAFASDARMWQQRVITRRREQLEEALRVQQVARRRAAQSEVELAARIAALRVRIEDLDRTLGAPEPEKTPFLRMSAEERAAVQEQKRALEAELSGLQAQAIEAERLSEALRAAEARLREKKETLNLEAALGAVTADLALLPEPADKAALEQAIQQIHQEAGSVRGYAHVSGVSDYARLEAQRRALQERLEQTRSAQAPLEDAIQQNLEARLAAARAEDERTVEAELRTLQAALAGSVQEDVVRSQTQALERVLRQVSAVPAALGTAAGRVVLDVPTALERDRQGAAALSAARRVRRQRDDLRRFLIGDVRTRVQDVAKRRNLRVQFDRPGPGVPDLTPRFEDWIAAANPVGEIQAEGRPS